MIYAIRRFLLKHFVPEFIWPEQVEIDGVVIKVRNSPYSFGTKMILKKGTYEAAEREILRDVLYPGAQVIEMGGSIGILSAVVSKGIGKKGRLISVEASKRLTAYSKTWLEELGNVVVETGFALPVLEAPKQLSVRSFDESAGSLGGIVKFDVDKENSSFKKNDIFDLKSIIDKHNVKPELLIVDIEGSETILMTIPPQIPSSVQMILIELHPGLYERHEEDETKIIDAICREGFEVRRKKQSSYLFKRLTP